MPTTTSLNLLQEQRGMQELLGIGANFTQVPEDIPWHNATGEGQEDDDAFYEANKLALILPRITAIISLFAVACVATEAWQDLRIEKSKKGVVRRGNRIRSNAVASNVSTITNIQLWYQLPLFCHAMAFALGTTTAPEGFGIWGAVGNTATCEAQGFLLQFGIFGVMGWDVALSTAYLMMVRYLVADFRLQSWEKYYHMVIWPSVLAICIIPLVQDMYNFNHSVCWLESYPNDCVDDECIRGEGAASWQTLASFAGVLHLVYSITVMVCIYCSIRGLETRRQQRFSSNFDSTSSQTREIDATRQSRTSSGTTAAMALDRHYSRAVATQGMLYSSGMIITTLPTAIYIVLWNLTGLWSPGFGIFATSMTPLMGYVNFVIFMRNRKATDCRTRYGRFLRRAHSWIWDYQLFCRCHCQCLPKHVGGGSGGRTASTASPNPHTDDGEGAQWTGPRSSTSNQQSTLSKKQTTSSLPIIEEGDVESSGEFKGTCGAWEIALKKQESRPSAEASELGQSEQVGAYVKHETCIVGDTVPTLPIRLASEVERPPVKPERLESCFSNMGMSELGSSITMSDDDSEEMDVAPTKPVRLTSQAELPPTRPERLESCVSEFGAPDASSVAWQDEHPAEDSAPRQPND
eukprot:CAMPEP_0117074690 /NCGR_PEP_ID=MMETSP0472-20121206/52628_1 /TAXON_ID=693140 ORGANISM="Tiarina fusus, Strain LIS" /NCGR_SAMPLE_ID=MMETSP0472 /ASSEMBLY_ACC=CAM_ASM_000603 /LENGTH=633 /DNA_ID=CAMNT_0004799827 /DNA_START=140 /DNA_END=2041 /DNA_ORIENTATION=+